MISYFSMYILMCFWALSYKEQKNNSVFPWLFLGLLFSIMIGFRDQVGGDWVSYLRHFNAMTYFTVNEIIYKDDPGYYLINWYLSNWGFEIYTANLIYGILFMTGLLIFARRQPNPALAVAVAIPYIIVVVAMGYTRQAVALGFVFWGLAALDKQHFKQFLILMFLAATFHKSAVLMIGLGIFLQGNGKVVRTIAVVAIGIGIYYAFLADYQQHLWKNYVELQMQSQGAFVRISMNFLPAIILLVYRNEWKQQFNDYSFWVIIALGSIASVILVNFASTAVDRVGLYFTPIQVVVYSRLPYLLRGRFNPQAITFGILLYYLLVLYVWLNYATHAKYWVPYNNVLFSDIL